MKTFISVGFKFFLVFFMLGLNSGHLVAQEEGDELIIIEEVGDLILDDGRLADEQTVDPDANQKWRMGQSKYPAKPKHAWELGIHAGHYFIDGDVDRTLPGGWGVGLHLRRAVNYVMSVRADFFYGTSTGLDPQPWAHRTIGSPGGGLVESTFDPYNPNTGMSDGYWFPSHKTRYIYGAFQFIINLSNILFHGENHKWNTYTVIGAGFDTHRTQLDLLDANEDPYTNLIERTGLNTINDFNTGAGRSAIKSELNSIYDGVYETEGFKKKGIFRLGDKTNLHAVFIGAMGISRKITKRFNIGMEHQIMVTDNDYLDGIKFRTSVDQTNNVDIGHYTNLRIAINLGNFDKVTEPLYWLNPLDAAFSDIAALKQRPELDLSDEDGDGVIDLLDQELGSDPDCPVDTRGVLLDSDEDGIADCLDVEPFSPPGYAVDQNGIADVPPSCCITEEDVNRIIQDRTTGVLRENKVQSGMGSNTPMNTTSTIVRSGCGEWFLPMIHFDLNKEAIKPQFYSQLHHVATVMEMCPELCIVAHGHTDQRNTNDYNTQLSYRRALSAIDYLVNNYAIDRNRIKLMYGGEENPLVSGTSEGQHYMNRRVEFRICKTSDYNMAAPSGGLNSSGSSIQNTNKYNGNKSSGY